jgi:Endoplasmic reticulum protein ERp29, C-terminal domain
LKEKLEEDKGFARVAEMDKLALKFIAEGANTASIIADAETQAGKASKEDKEAAALYVTFMKRALDKVCGQ